MSVTACVCHELPFDQLLTHARRHGCDFETLRAQTQCCTSCSLCEPYVRQMLETGQTVFEVAKADAVAAKGTFCMTTTVQLSRSARPQTPDAQQSGAAGC